MVACLAVLLLFVPCADGVEDDDATLHVEPPTGPSEIWVSPSDVADVDVDIIDTTRPAVPLSPRPPPAR